MSNSYSLYNTETQEVIPLADTAITLGRSENCGLRINSRDASREHARLYISKGGLAIDDLQSTNGTYVNGVRITEPQHLAPGDSIKIAGEVFTVRMQDLSSQTRLTSIVSMTQIMPAISVKKKPSRLRNFLGLFSFSRNARTRQAVSYVPSFASTHSATINKYLDYFKKNNKGQSKIVLFFYKNDETVAVHCVAEEPTDNTWSIGRCQTSYLVVDDDSVSMHHASLSFTKGVWTLKDQRSTNGVMAYGLRKEAVKLFDEADLRLGDIKLYVRMI